MEAHGGSHGTDLPRAEGSAKSKMVCKASGSGTDPGRRSGFVAAWYVSEQKGKTASSSPAPAPSPSTAPAPKPGGSSSSPAPSSAPAPVPPGALAFYPTEELSLRSKPVISAETLIRRVPTIEQLISLEPASQTIPKIGVQNQWLKVRDGNKKEGYVAAWYLKYAGGSTAQAASTSAPAPASGGAVKCGQPRSRLVAQGTHCERREPDQTRGSVSDLPSRKPASKDWREQQWLKVKDATRRLLPHGLLRGKNKEQVCLN